MQARDKAASAVLPSDMVVSFSWRFRPRPSRPDGTANKAARARGGRAPVQRKAEAPAGKRPWQLDRPGGGFTRDMTQAACRGGGQWTRDRKRRRHRRNRRPCAFKAGFTEHCTTHGTGWRVSLAPNGRASIRPGSLRGPRAARSNDGSRLPPGWPEWKGGTGPRGVRCFRVTPSVQTGISGGVWAQGSPCYAARCCAAR